MKKAHKAQQRRHFSNRRSSVLQKSIHHTTAQKLTDAFIAILAGAHGLAEIDTRVRSDEALQLAFGRDACARYHSTLEEETHRAADGDAARKLSS